MTPATCPNCGAPLPPGHSDCPSCRSAWPVPPGGGGPTSSGAWDPIGALGGPDLGQLKWPEPRDASSGVPPVDEPVGVPSSTRDGDTQRRSLAGVVADAATAAAEAGSRLVPQVGPGNEAVSPTAAPDEAEGPPTRGRPVEPLGTALVGPGRTLVIDPYDPSLEETFLDGLEPVRVEPGDRADGRPPNRRPTRRAAPMVGVLSVLLAGVVAAALGARGGPAAEDEASAPVNDVIDLPAATVPLGLTDDNKETVLAACMRMSGNPNTECRHVYLRDLGEFPHRQVDFPPLGVDRYEVSNAQYEQCVEAGGCTRRPIDECRLYTHRGYQIGAAIPERMLLDEMPASCVTRAEAAQYCEWAGGRLPTPDEWERVARAGDDRLAPWGALWTPRILNWGETDMGGFSVVGMLDGYELTAPVDRFAAGRTPDGVYNMLGNVAEWVAPWAEMPDGTRGGSYRDTLHNLRVTFQNELRPEARRSDVGFRCVYD